MKKWIAGLMLLACFLLGLAMYIDIISNLEVDFRFYKILKPRKLRGFFISGLWNHTLHSLLTKAPEGQILLYLVVALKKPPRLCRRNIKNAEPLQG
jgi:hypothetical protein